MRRIFEVEEFEQFRTVFDDLGKSSGSLASSGMCSSVHPCDNCLPNESARSVEHMGTPTILPEYNHTVTLIPDQQDALTSLFRAFKTLPSCKIELFITYTVEEPCSFPVDEGFHRLHDGAYTFRNSLAPMNCSAVQTFLDKPAEHPIPPFDLSVRYLDKWIAGQLLQPRRRNAQGARHGEVPAFFRKCIIGVQHLINRRNSRL